MKELEDKIRKDGQVLPGNVLKVGKFLNQQVDSALLKKMAKEVKRLFKDTPITKVLTVEASGITFATAVALELNVPMVFAKKHVSANVTGDQLKQEVYSYTHKKTYTISVTKEYISPSDKVLILDDFLATGNAIVGLIGIVKDGGATVAGICSQIEKAFQGGGDTFRQQGYRVESLAIVERMENGLIFRK